MSDNNQVKPEQVNDKTKRQKNKKMLLWAILIVVVAIVLYVLFGDNSKKFRLNTEVRAALPTGSESTMSSTPVVTETYASMPASSSLSVDTDSASAVRQELANLFKSYV